MQYSAPKCYGCKFFKSAPKTIGGSAQCTMYPNGVPHRIFFEGANCKKYLAKTGKKK